MTMTSLKNLGLIWESPYIFVSRIYNGMFSKILMSSSKCRLLYNLGSNHKVIIGTSVIAMTLGMSVTITALLTH
jgi:hypothetical protein